MILSMRVRLTALWRAGRGDYDFSVRFVDRPGLQSGLEAPRVLPGPGPVFVGWRDDGGDHAPREVRQWATVDGVTVFDDPPSRGEMSPGTAAMFDQWWVNAEREAAGERWAMNVFRDET
jgi:hypothetical protein